MTAPRRILHFLTPLKNVSPFDVNMARALGFDVVVPYTDVDVKEVTGLVQDAIFSRAPENGRHTAVLIGGGGGGRGGARCSRSTWWTPPGRRWCRLISRSR